MWHKIVSELLEVPWAEVSRLLVTAFCCWVTWRWSRRYYCHHWLRQAPDEAKEQLLQARRDLAGAQRIIKAMQADNAELRGRIAAAMQRLEKPRQLELIERAAGR